MTRSRWVTVVVLASALAAGATTRAGGQTADVSYAGLSAQRLPFTLTVGADGQTLSLDVTWMTACGGLVRSVRPAVTTIGPDGAFTWTGTFVNALDDGDEDRQRLRIAGRRETADTISGVWHADRDSYNGEAREIDGTCSSGDVAFRVTRGGSTRQPAPQRDALGQLAIGLDDVPELVATGAGRTWVLGHTAQVSAVRFSPTLTVVDPQTGAAATPFRIDGGGELAAGEGAAWLVRTAPSGRAIGLLRVDARTLRITRGPALPAPGDALGLVSELTTGAGGVWLLRDDRVLQAEPKRGRLVRAIRMPADRRTRSARRCSHFVRATLIAVRGDDVRVMTTTGLHCRSHASARSFALARRSPFYELSRIDRRTGRVTRAVPLTRQYSALAAGRSGVWGVACLKLPAPPLFACRRPAVHRIDLRSGRPAVAVALPAPAAQPPLLHALATELAVGAGAVWVVQPDEPAAAPSYRQLEPPGVLRRIDVATRRVSTVRTVPHLPTGLAADEHGTWLLDGLNRALIRVAP